MINEAYIVDLRDFEKICLLTMVLQGKFIKLDDKAQMKYFIKA